MPLEASMLTLAIGMPVGNFVYQGMTKRNWRLAMERSVGLWVVLLVAYLFLR